MNYYILLAIIPLVGWALGDFFIQKTARKIGVIQTLFFIGITSTIFCFPFAYKKLLHLSVSDYTQLFILSIAIFIYAVLLFKAFKVGKLSVVESIVAIEMPLTVGLAVLITGESLNFSQLTLFILICFGIVLATNKYTGRAHKMIFEKGVTLALASSALSAFVNFYIGVAAQNISPFLTIYVTHVFLALFCAAIIIYNRQISVTIEDIKSHPVLIGLLSFFDNVAWYAYAYTVTYIPISLAIIITESYIILAALLGYYFNKEKLSKAQKIGAGIALVSVMLLIFVSQGLLK